MRFKNYIKEYLINERSNRFWYHGTSYENWKKIQKKIVMIPNVADVESYGAAIWFTSDLEEAKSYGRVVLSMDNNTFMSFSHKKVSPWPYGFKKRMGITEKHAYIGLIFDNIPVKKLHATVMTKSEHKDFMNNFFGKAAKKSGGKNKVK